MPPSLQPTPDASTDTAGTDGSERSDGAAGRREGADPPGVQFEELLEVLGDEYACELLRELDGAPVPARDLVERCEMSRPTVYRRLDRLTDAGIVAALPPSPEDGRDCREFVLVVEEFALQVRDDGIDGTVQAGD